MESWNLVSVRIRGDQLHFRDAIDQPLDGWARCPRHISQRRKVNRIGFRLSELSPLLDLRAELPAITGIEESRELLIHRAWRAVGLASSSFAPLLDKHPKLIELISRDSQSVQDLEQFLHAVILCLNQDPMHSILIEIKPVCYLPDASALLTNVAKDNFANPFPRSVDVSKRLFPGSGEPFLAFAAVQ